MSTKPSNNATAAPAEGATITNISPGSQARIDWGWCRIERLCQLYVDGDPEMARLSTGPNPQPLGETVSLGTAMCAGIPLEPVRELWAKAKAHMVALAEWKAKYGAGAGADTDAEGGPAA
jgi:hypothetical protein